MSDKLKSCPFCGENDNIHCIKVSDSDGYQPNDGYWEVYCRSCNSRTNGYHEEKTAGLNASELPTKIDTIGVDTVGWTKYGDLVTDPLDTNWIVSPFRFGDNKRRVFHEAPILKYTTDTTYYLTLEQVEWVRNMPDTSIQWETVDSVMMKVQIPVKKTPDRR